MLDFEGELGKAVKHSWQVRGKQKKRQGGKTGKRMPRAKLSHWRKPRDGFIRPSAIVRMRLFAERRINVTEKKPRTLPGFYRPSKVGSLLFCLETRWWRLSK
jgi:hypothetical protein